jgi:hypothetical protein
MKEELKMRHVIMTAVLSALLPLQACGKGEDPLPAVSQDALLPAAEVRSVFEGNTLEVARAHGQMSFKAFFAKNGSVVAIVGDARRKGTWRIQDNGMHCLQWEGRPERCRRMAKDEQGKYMLVDQNLRPMWLIENIEAGAPVAKGN